MFKSHNAPAFYLIALLSGVRRVTNHTSCWTLRAGSRSEVVGLTRSRTRANGDEIAKAAAEFRSRSYADCARIDMLQSDCFTIYRRGFRL